MPTEKERRASHEYTRSLNKPGRVGSFAEEERNRKADEKQERASSKPQRQDVKLPGAALLITIGLFILWLAASGNLKKIGQAWDFIRGKTENLPSSGGIAGAVKSGLTGIHDFSNYHVETHLAQPSLSTTNVGGLN